MSEQNREGLRPVRRSLLSVSDKAGIVEFARELQRSGGRYGIASACKKQGKNPGGDGASDYPQVREDPRP